MNSELIRKYSNFIYDYFMQNGILDFVYYRSDNDHFLILKLKKKQSLPLDFVISTHHIEVSTESFPEVFIEDITNEKKIKSLLDVVFKSRIEIINSKGGINKTTLKFLDSEENIILRKGPLYSGIPIPFFSTKKELETYMPYLRS